MGVLANTNTPLSPLSPSDTTITTVTTTSSGSSSGSSSSSSSGFQIPIGLDVLKKTRKSVCLRILCIFRKIPYSWKSKLKLLLLYLCESDIIM